MSTQHIMLLKFRDDVRDSDRQSIWFNFAALRPEIDGFENLHFGPNNSAEGLGRGYSHAFVMEFYNAAARDVFLGSPKTQELNRKLIRMLKGGLDGMIVFDIET